jgi:hypothetical protein
MSLLARAWPDEFAVRVAAARELSQILGDDHDLAMLIGATAAAEDISSENKEAIVELCLRKQQVLRAAAQNRAERLFAERPRAFVRRVAMYWKFGRVAPLSDTVTIPRQSNAEAPHPAPESQGATADIKPVSPKPRLAAKTATAAPSQRRA